MRMFSKHIQSPIPLYCLAGLLLISELSETGTEGRLSTGSYVIDLFNVAVLILFIVLWRRIHAAQQSLSAHEKVNTETLQSLYQSEKRLELALEGDGCGDVGLQPANG